MEHFLIKDPLADFRIPIDKENWFDASKVQSKRAEIATVLRIKTDEANPEVTKPMPELKFSDDSIVVDGDNNNDATVIDKMEEDRIEELPGDFPMCDAEQITKPSEIVIEVPSQAEIIANSQLQDVSSSTAHQSEQFMLSSQDVFDEHNSSGTTNNSNEVDPLDSEDHKMQIDDEPIVLSD